jgi:hypothetical protein
MPLSGKEFVRFGRAVTTAAAMVATSGVLQATGQPLFTVVDQIAFNLAAAQSEARKLREKAAVLLIAPQHIPQPIEHA